jgi:anti-anti-sigma regulatory factor
VTQSPETGPPPGTLDIVHRVVSGTLVVAVAGEIDSDTVPELHAAVTASL